MKKWSYRWKRWCPKCLNKYGKTDKFCISCGYSLKNIKIKEERIDQTFIIYMKCFKCKKDSRMARYCPYCGQRQLPLIPEKND